MNTLLIDKLNEALEIAKEKEEIAKKENKETKPGDAYRITIKFSNLTNAQGFTNGLLEAIELTRLYEGKE